MQLSTDIIKTILVNNIKQDVIELLKHMTAEELGIIFDVTINVQVSTQGMKLDMEIDNNGNVDTSVEPD